MKVFSINLRNISRFSTSSTKFYIPLCDSKYYSVLFQGADTSTPPHAFNLSNTTLKQNYLSKQKQFHPDKPNIDHNYALQTSSLINKAYETLLHPLSRAVYLLELNGIEIAESDSIHDSTLLMDMLELREQLEDAQSEEEVTQLRHDNGQSIQQTTHLISQAFENNDLESAKNLTIKLRYLCNLDVAARDWQPGAPVVIQH
ncbi:hypothetical protein E3P86_03616 [Wallemia ichthyophaga]|uniref:J domain-containing protein n=1 Tax=Wallemia ichthyophaga TaxID=245174 RepID=A0A4T0IIX7_WALIC|nr:hypothetical protein E3P86_03616 [Wallemia ichthyophaga]